MPKGDKLNMALIQKQVVSSVKRGENAGRELHHINVVRDCKTVGSEGNARLEMSSSLHANDIRIVAYQQNSKRRILAVKEIAVKQ